MNEQSLDFQLDVKETVEICVDHEELFRWMLAAHALDITLNQFVEQALIAFIEQHGDIK